MTDSDVVFTLKETRPQFNSVGFFLGGGISLRSTLVIPLCDKPLAFPCEQPDWDENMQIRFLREYLHIVVPQAFSRWVLREAKGRRSN